jgi:hypothetical protein
MTHPMPAPADATGLRSIVYVSDATSELTLDALEKLLVQARELNHDNGITGVLLYSGGNIMQCFEGPEAAVALTYARIRSSRRHRNLVELMNEPVAERSFDGWDMGLGESAGSELLDLSTARWTALAASPAPPPGLELLQMFWQNARR